ncbi:MAG TPA: class I SAM-dependent methyltransferase [Acidimicrobiales bacterium]
MPDYDVNENSDVYYQGRYWNDYDAVVRMINERISGDPALTWYEHFAKVSNRTFERALILNCGNGWVERDLLDSGLILGAVGIDYSEELLGEARAAAERGNLPLAYEQANVNAGKFPRQGLDLVVNHAAAHHIAAIDRVFREICRILPEEGWFVSFDYVGPHRNQYLASAWEAAWELNEQIPESLRQDLRYPHLPTMLVDDPTEAIHSELILQTFRRYFTVRQLTPLGGAIAYPLLTHNTKMWEAVDVGARSEWVARILQADDQFLAENPDSSLFAYFAGMPDKSVLGRIGQLSEWEAAETERESRASRNGGEYYTRGALATAFIARDAEHMDAQQTRARVSQLESELHALRSGTLYSMTRRLLDAKTTRRLRANRFVAAVERRLRATLS